MTSILSLYFTASDPNRPVQMGIPWPEFTLSSGTFLEFNSKGVQEITTPEEERLDRVIRTIFSARSQQWAADKPKGRITCKTCSDRANDFN